MVDVLGRYSTETLIKSRKEWVSHEQHRDSITVGGLVPIPLPGPYSVHIGVGTVLCTLLGLGVASITD